MGVDSIPLRWPAAWKDPGMLSLLQATSIRHLFIDPGANIAEPATRAGFTVVEPAALPPGVTVVKGLWPGIRVSHSGGDRAAAGPTGEPWVDSNGWRVRAAKALRPDAQVWVDAKAPASRSSAEDYVLAFADAAAHRGRWIVDLDDRLAEDLASKKAEAMTTWKRITQASAFFAPNEIPTDEAVIGVLATFTGPKVGFTDEVLNNLSRTRQQYRAIASSQFTAASLAGLKGVIYTDAGEPPANVRKQVLDFVNAGGMLITGPSWSSLPNGPATGTHPRFASRVVGRGAIALATTSFIDPYLAANDAVVLVSHRHDVVRFFNSGAIAPCLSISADKRRAALDTVFYSLRPVEDASVWVRGAWHSARIRTWNQPHPQTVKLEVRDAGAEIFLPAVAQYARIELES
jgi:hypothetical protein